MADIHVEEAGQGQYTVEVVEGSSRSQHTVTVTAEEQARFGPDSTPEALVRESFVFLLEREPKEAILGRFSLSTIQRYFGSYGTDIVKRLS